MSAHAPHLETARLRLEPWDDAHFERFARFMRNLDVIRYVRREPLDRARALELHQRSLVDWDAYGFGRRAIVERETDRWLGFVELSLVGPGKGSRDDDVEIGYFVEPSRWGEGIATEASMELRDEAFGRCGLSHLVGRCRVENIASARVLAKMGFRRRVCSSSTTGSSWKSTPSAASGKAPGRGGRSTSATRRSAGSGIPVKRADRALVVDRQPGGATQLYDVVLLAGSPRRLTLNLAPDVAVETAIEVDGELWTVADVRAVDGGPTAAHLHPRAVAPAENATGRRRQASVSALIVIARRARPRHRPSRASSRSDAS